MAQWHVKELSDLTGVSVRALHHYDKIGLLKPSARSSNGYRYYAQNDLVTLQQIAALKFFGFGLSQIKTMLQSQPGMLEHLQTQQAMLKDQVVHLQNAQAAMDTIILRLKNAASFEWQDLLSLIEGYRMTEALKKTWYGRALNEAQLAEWVALKKQFPKEFALQEKLVAQINNKEVGDPEGPDGERLMKVFLENTQKIKAAIGRVRKLNADILRSIKEGKISDTPLTPEGNLWVAKAQLAFYLKRIDRLYQDIADHLHEDPEGAEGKRIAKSWRDMVEEAFIGTSRDLGIGLMLWQELGRQQAAIQNQATLSVQDQIKEVYAKICFNPEAMSWIEKALNTH
jgi:DNA-binding transcriptional MerR regulator